MNTYQFQCRWENDLVLYKDVEANTEKDAKAKVAALWGSRARGILCYNVIPAD